MKRARSQPAKAADSVHAAKDAVAVVAAAAAVVMAAVLANAGKVGQIQAQKT
jgi:hypothetical protein